MFESYKPCTVRIMVTGSLDKVVLTEGLKRDTNSTVIVLALVTRKDIELLINPVPGSGVLSVMAPRDAAVTPSMNHSLVDPLWMAKSCAVELMHTNKSSESWKTTGSCAIQ